MNQLKIAITLLGTLLLFSSCSNTNKENKSTEFTFFIHGKAINGNGEILQLTIPTATSNNIFETTVQNERYSFKGTLSSNDIGKLSVKDKMEGFSPLTIYLTKDTLQLDLEIGEKFGETIFVKDTITKNVINLFARNFNEAYDDINSVWFFRDSLKNDSMRKNVYPTVRKQTFALLENRLTKKEHSVIKLHYLREILEDNVVYDKNDMTKAEKLQLKSYFKEIDSSLQHTSNYKIARSYVDKLDETGEKQQFIDYTLQNNDGKVEKLSEIISENRFTLVEFWHSGCIPCRKFNVEAKPLYEQLKTAGIEIISINTDRMKKAWTNASKTDEIAWKNLYAGNDSPIIPDYHIVAYPTSYIFDEHQQLVEFEFKKAEDLLKLIEKK